MEHFSKFSEKRNQYPIPIRKITDSHHSLVSPPLQTKTPTNQYYTFRFVTLDADMRNSASDNLTEAGDLHHWTLDKNCDSRVTTLPHYDDTINSNNETLQLSKGTITQIKIFA